MKLRKFFTTLSIFTFLSMPFFVGATVITIDNTDAGFSSNGFSSSTFAGGFIGSEYMFDTVNVVGDFAVWNPTNLLGWLAGEWKVEINWTAGSNRANEALITIGSGLANLTVNQKVMGGRWNDLGTYNFDLTNASVKIDDSNSTRGQYVIADAVRFTLITPAQVTTATEVSTPATLSLVLISGLLMLRIRRR